MVANGDGLKTIATVSLTAPTAGFVLVQANVDINAPNTINDIGVRVLDPVTTNASWEHEFSPPAFGAGDVSASAVFPVAAGAHTFDVQGQIGSGTGSATTFTDATAIFSPFGSTGGSTLTPKHPVQARLEPPTAHR